jgi:hypothetical protein
MKHRYPTQKAVATALRMQSSQRAAAASKPRTAASSKRRSASAWPYPVCYHHFLQ